MTEDKVWWLGSAGTYRDRPGQGCFGGTPDLVSIHSFGWDKKAQGFVIKDELGIGGSVPHRLPMPVELAEQFLMACLYEDFRQTFLLEIYGAKESEEEFLRACGYTLRVSRGKARPGLPGSGRWFLPELSLACFDPEGKSRSGLFFFSDFRVNFGRTMKSMSATDIRKQLGTG